MMKFLYYIIKLELICLRVQGSTTDIIEVKHFTFHSMFASFLRTEKNCSCFKTYILGSPFFISLCLLSLIINFAIE